jgi:tetratricopeptide (TPR) repeat protein
MKLLLLLLFVCVSCATRTPVTDKLAKTKEHFRIKDVPVIKQEKYHCGPASLAMVMGFYGQKKTPDELAKGLFHEKLKGSTFSEMKARARQEGFLVLEINKFDDAIKEVKAGNPVIVLQNNGFRFFPMWHFSVLTGVDLRGPDVIVHDGDDEEDKDDMRLFERSFILGGRRSLLLLPPDHLSETTDEKSHVEAAAFLEALGNLKGGLLAYQKILSRWPQSQLAQIGVANTLYALGRKEDALKEIRIGSKLHPQSFQIWHNRAVMEAESGYKQKARESAKKALELAEKDQKEKVASNLKEWL